MNGAELRVVNGKNVMDLNDDELKRVKDVLAEAELPVVSIASPVLKCVLPNAPEVDSRFQHDIFASKHTFEDQPRLAEHAFKLAKFFNTRVIRVFSYWRTVDPEQCFDAVVNALSDLASKAAKEDLIIGLENEHACHVGTAAESAKLLAAVQQPNLKLVWDPANAMVGGETPFPDGYSLSAEGPDCSCACKGLPHGRREAHLGTAGNAACGLERSDCGTGGRRIQGLHQPGDPLGRTQRGQRGSQPHLRMESARPGGGLDLHSAFSRALFYSSIEPCI